MGVEVVARSIYGGLWAELRKSEPMDRSASFFPKTSVGLTAAAQKSSDLMAGRESGCVQVSKRVVAVPA